MNKRFFTIIVFFITIIGTCFAQPSSISYLETAANRGERRAQEYLGEGYLLGLHGASINYEKAYEWLLMAAKQGSSKAQYLLYSDERMQFKSEADGYRKEYWMEKSALLGYIPAVEDYATILVEKKNPRAFSLLKQYESENHPGIILLLGDCYCYGIGVKRDMLKGNELWGGIYNEARTWKESQGDIQDMKKQYVIKAGKRIGEYILRYLDDNKEMALPYFETAFNAIPDNTNPVITSYAWCLITLGQSMALYRADSLFQVASSSVIPGIKCDGLIGSAYMYSMRNARNESENENVFNIGNKYAKDAQMLAINQKQLICALSAEFLLNYNKRNDVDKQKSIASKIDKILAQNDISEELRNDGWIYRPYLHYYATIQNLNKDNVDNNIFKSEQINNTTFAVIISNESYKRVEPVTYASNDGKIFREYCLKTLGIPENNIQYIQDATLNDIKYSVNWLAKVIKAYNGKAKIVFYYAGHGIPNEATKDAFLLPIDGYGTDTSTGYSLNELYSTLGNMPTEQVVILLDACFSGAQRGNGMLASARGVAIKAKPDKAEGKMVVISAAQGDETAYPYQDESHGLFTYYLLKKLKESQGNVSLGELATYIKDNVSKKSIVVNGKSQTPSINPSTSLGDSWKNWTLK